MIKSGVEKLRYINNWTECAPDLAHVFLAGMDFSNENLSNFDFTSAYLPEAQFVNAVLNEVNFSDAVLTRANFSGADLSKADFRGAHLDGANFHNCILKGADFTDASMEAVSYPMTCNGFHGVKHSMENVQYLLGLFQLLKDIDPELIKVIRPWFNKKLRLPDDQN